MGSDPKFDAELARAMEAVALKIMPEFMGEPNRALSSPGKEWRWGKKGAFSVDCKKGVYNDHEDGDGGGVLKLLQAYRGYSKAEALEWLEEQGHIDRREQQYNGANGAAKPQGKFAGFMDDHPIATFQYFDDKGKLAYEVLKFAKTAPRRYMQRRPHPAGGWIWGLQAGLYGKTKSGDWFKAKAGKHYEDEKQFEDTKWVLYNRAEVLKAIKEGRPVVLVEGEKDVETLREWGQVGTTNQGGAKNWHPELNADLAGADLVICSDLDDAGKARTMLRGADLRPIAKRVRSLDLALHWKDAPEKSDVTDWKDQAGGTSEKFEILVKKAPAWVPERPRAFGAYYHDELDGPGLEYDYIIDGLITTRGRSIIGGPSGSGKSFLALHAAYCVARGQDFFDYSVERGGVIYQAGEGGLGMKKRQKAYRKHFNVSEDEEIPLVVLPAKVDLYSREGDTDRLIEAIKSIKITMSMPLRIVFIDTLATATVGADENSGKDMSVVLANIARIEHECGCHVCLVHHMNADGKKLRGHTSIHANVDTVIVVNQDEETRIRTARLAKQKDDEDGIKITFSLASVPVGLNPKTQREITSCVVLTVGEKERLKKEQERQGFYVNPTERRIMMNLFDTVDRHGKFIANDKEGPKAAVGRVVVDWKDYLVVALEKMLEVEDKAKATDQIRKEFARAKDGLTKYGLIKMVKPYMWWDGKPIRGFKRTFPKPEISDEDRTSTGQTPDEPVSEGMRELFETGGDIVL
ncbi:AAA family ATPase [Mesorhizobium sp. C280B]|uniref:AAA family ATPase n=1 Tax=unclassified Mesorhizobium TaxID=325217 RepID=UPI0003CF282A|nr:AAA family ATPase [Mesorhizobium sp. LSJC280B00]ESW92945.1 hypothetical protein X772_03065 [Mesorhizobium sp. LSJC280B00]